MTDPEPPPNLPDMADLGRPAHKSPSWLRAIWDAIPSDPVDMVLGLGIGIYAIGAWTVGKLRGKRPS